MLLTRSVNIMKTIIVLVFLILSFSSSPRRDTFAVEGVGEGQSKMTKPSDANSPSVSSDWTSGNGSDIARCRSLLWPDRVLYLVIGPFTARQRYILHQTIAYLHTLSIVRFEEIWHEPEDKSVKFVAISKATSPGCFTDLGYSSPKPRMMLADGCFSLTSGYSYSGVLLHELLHILGFEHEHQRADRDSYVTINANMEDEYGFKRWPTRSLQECINSPYDFESLMHYRMFVSEPQTGRKFHFMTLAGDPKDHNVLEDSIGNYVLSSRDIIRLQIAYQGPLDAQYCVLRDPKRRFLVGNSIYSSCELLNGPPMHTVGSFRRRCLYGDIWAGLKPDCSAKTVDNYPVLHCNFEDGSNCDFLRIDGEEWRSSQVFDSLLYGLHYDVTRSESFGAVVSYRRLPKMAANHHRNLSTEAIDMSAPFTCVHFSYFYSINVTSYTNNAVTIRVFAQYSPNFNQSNKQVERFLAWSNNEADKSDNPQITVEQYRPPNWWHWIRFYLPQNSNRNYDSKLWEKRIVWSVSFADEEAAITSGEIAMFGVALDEIVVHQCADTNRCFCNIS